MTKINKNKAKKGFGLIEVLISAAILIVILGALVAIGRMALTNIRVSQERAQATYLAQEGLEVARQIRDTNWVDGRNDTTWDSFFLQSRINEYLIDHNSLSVAIDKYSGSQTLCPHCFKLHLGTDPYFAVDGVNYDRCMVIERTTGSANPLLPTSDPSVFPTNDYPNKSYHSILVRIKIYWPGNDTCTQGSRKMVETTELLTDWRPNF